jgi:DNA helicase-2/ATP-dependent DNA helicase PcrA
VDLISYLKVLYNFDDSVSFYRILAMDHFGIDDRDLIRLTNRARQENLNLFDACERYLQDTSEKEVNLNFISDDSKEQIKKVVEMVNKHIKLVKKESAGQILYYFFLDGGFLPNFINPDSPDSQKRAINIAKFFDKLKSYEGNHEDSTVPAIVDWIELSSELGESPLAANFDWSDSNAVSILSVHSSKGLEFPIVFMVNLVSQRFPTTERKEQIPIPEELIKEVLPKGDYHVEEERRLFYVGMTRAKDILYLTAADYYGEGIREKKLSPFIFEALGEDILSAENSSEKGKQLSFLDYKPHEVNKQLTTNNLQPFHVDYLSYSQIESFKICPLHYKMNYIYKISTPASAAQSFGTTIHATLKNFYEEVSKFNNEKNGEVPSNSELIFSIFEKNWINKGYVNKSHEKEFFEKGKVYLDGYLHVNFNPRVMPVTLEQRFTIPISLGEGKLMRIGGVVDRADILEDGTLEITDYKTGATIPSQKEVDNNLQMTFYALAATTIPDLPFGKTPDKVKLSMYFLDQQEKITTTRTRDQLNGAIEEIFKYKDEIEASDFRCSGHMFCQNNCEYSLFCKSDQEQTI